MSAASFDTGKWPFMAGGRRLDAADYLCFLGANATRRRFPRLSRPVPAIRPEYDVIVIGSGYGGGVAASRMSRVGKTVAVLEIGKERWPGEYPSNLVEAAPEVHVSGYLDTTEKSLEVECGPRNGLYHLILGKGQSVFVANGLGGTSLLNANVFLPADKRTLALHAWPPELRQDVTALEKYYTRAAEMLQPMPYPESYPKLSKLEALKMQAEVAGQLSNFYRVPQTTCFHDGPNKAGVEMKASTGSGQDCTGVNDGSKNTVLVTYLADAWNWGAEIFCECEVRYIEEDKKHGGYIVFFAWLGAEREVFKDDVLSKLMWVRAKELCFLGAGALGTTEILLRSQKHGLSTSLSLGQKVSGNGDILSFAYNTDSVVNGVGRELPDAHNPPGPTITGIIDNRNSETSKNVLDGYVIEDGVIPAALAPVIQTVLESLPGKVYPPFHPSRAIRYFLATLQSRVFGPYTQGGSVNRTQTYLLMSHDSNEGILALVGNKPSLQFVGVGKTERVSKLREVMATATGKMGGALVDGPLSAGYMREQLTVHPLGGAIMSYDGTGQHGAVDHMGRLFDGQGSEVHSGILCVDAAIIPTSLGINPFATITALAERTCDLLIAQQRLVLNDAENDNLDLFGAPKISQPFSQYIENYNTTSIQGNGVRFTEIMDGFIHIGDNISDFEIAYDVAKGSSSAASLYITVDTFRVDNITSLANNASIATGTFSCGALSQHPLLIQDGKIQFFTVDEHVSDATNLVYDLTLLSSSGEIFLLYGEKVVDSSITMSISQTWKATTTLYTSIRRPNGSLVGKGILRISWRNFLDELESFGAPETMSKPSRLLNNIFTPLKFVKFFAEKTLNFFFSPLRPLQYPDKSRSGYLQKPAPDTIVELTAADGVKIPMHIWRSRPDVAKRALSILLIPGASVDYQIFALPTINTNTIDYFTALGYTCYVPTLRFGLLPVAKEGHTAYDARLDVKAAMEYVRECEVDRKFYLICHCLGSIATGMALLKGDAKTEWIAGMTASQVFMNPRFGHINRIKSATQILEKVYTTVAGSWFPSDSSPDSPFFQRLLDQVLRIYPVGTKNEICNSTVCHRCSLVFGRLWTHSKLNHATHAHLSNFFGGLDMKFLSHLTLMGSMSPQHLRSNKPLLRDLVNEPGNLDRLQGLKIQFLSGGANVVFDPWSTSESYDMFREMFGTDNYERVVVEGYGHLDTWMGKNSCEDVYPRVRSHVESCK